MRIKRPGVSAPLYLERPAAHAGPPLAQAPQIISLIRQVRNATQSYSPSSDWAVRDQYAKGIGRL